MHVRYIGLAGWVLMIAVAALAVSDRVPEVKPETKKKHQLAWWESARPAQPTAAAQLAYANELQASGHLIKASRQYRAITYAWPQSPEAPLAQYNYAQLLERRGKPESAFEEYQYLLESYAGFVPYEEILERQYGIADRRATQPRRFLFFSYHAPEEAIPLFEILIRNAPRWQRAAEMQFRIARIYEKNKQYAAALDEYSLYQQKYPLSPLMESAAFGHAKSAYQYSKENFNALELRQHAEAILISFLERYPNSEMAGQAQTYLQDLQMAQAATLYKQALSYERSTRSVFSSKEKQALMMAARLCYQRVILEYPLSRWTETARARINRLDQRLEGIHDN